METKKWTKKGPIGISSRGDTVIYYGIINED
jgi:hypothetical protein